MNMISKSVSDKVDYYTIERVTCDMCNGRGYLLYVNTSIFPHIICHVCHGIGFIERFIDTEGFIDIKY